MIVKDVVVLVVMESGLKDYQYWFFPKFVLSRSPCCNGEWFKSVVYVFVQTRYYSRSPCCNGEWFKSTRIVENMEAFDIRRSPCCNGEWFKRF